MNRKIELLAPGGDIDSIKAAIAAGADALYCGLNQFNARNRATNIELADLHGVLRLAHSHGCKVYLTLNIIIVESEIKTLVNLLNKLVNTSIDGIIVQDLGLLYLLSKHYKGLEVHASTQLTTHNQGQIKFLSQLNATQVNLSRELSLAEIEALTPVAHKHRIKTEIFVHGSNCLSFSGLCYMSSVNEGKSGNRGRCSQPCRDNYLITPAGNNFPLNLKDNSAYLDLKDIAAAGVDSIKIEGRIKKFHYVYTVVKAWRDQLEKLYQGKKLDTDYGALQKVFNRDFSNSFLMGTIDRGMFIDNPMDDSARHLAQLTGRPTEENVKIHNKTLHDLRAEIVTNVGNKIKHLSIEKSPLTISVSGEAGTPLQVFVRTPETSFVVSSATELVQTDAYILNLHARDQRTQPHAFADSQKVAGKITVKDLDSATLARKFKPLNDTEYCIQHLETEGLKDGLFLPSNELTTLKKKILFALSGSKARVAPLQVPLLEKKNKANAKPTLSVLISSLKDLRACAKSSAKIFFQLPSCFESDYSGLIDIFLKNTELTPWFPSVLIGNDFAAAVDILQQVQPKRIVTNNTGIAYEANRMGISWIAGPTLNLVNSFSLLCLKENFNCYGAFVSSEISRQQIKDIVAPADFELYYSLYHPLLLLTSRQCLFHQIVGCDKDAIDADCLRSCHKTSSLTNLNAERLSVEKIKGDYHNLYSHNHFLNTDIVTELPDVFSSFLVDLRDVRAENNRELDRSRIVACFAALLKGKPDSEQALKQMLPSATNAQYINGL